MDYWALSLYFDFFLLLSAFITGFFSYLTRDVLHLTYYHRFFFAILLLSVI